jgi:hypothetical protein
VLNGTLDGDEQVMSTNQYAGAMVRDIAIRNP